MLLVLLLSAAMTVLSSSRSDEDKVIDLQELLLNVSDSYRDFGQSIKDLGSDVVRNFKLIVDNINTNVQDSVNTNAKRAEELANANAKLMLENFKLLNENIKTSANANAEILRENTDVLKDILVAFDKIEKCCDPVPTTTTTITTKTPETTTTSASAQGRDCSEIYIQGERLSRPYVIDLPSIQQSFKVFCDMKTDGGGWTVFQRRGDYGNSQHYFDKTWIDYKNGFGELEKEFWLGNDRISALTQHKQNVLLVDLWDLEGNHVFAKYNVFRVENEQQSYKLSISGFSGNAGDSMLSEVSTMNLNNMLFTTKDKDKDNDNYPSNCAVVSGGGGGWWYNACSYSNLNGLNLRGGNNFLGIRWYFWKNSWYSMAFAEMKIRPANFQPVNES